MPHNESTLDKAIRYLEQQQQMNGNLLFKEPKRTSPHAPNTHTASVEKRTEATVKQAPGNGGMSADTVPVPAKQPVKSTTKQRFIMPTRKTAMFENSPEWMNAPDLPVLYEQIHTCLNCALGATRTKFVFGVGNPNADIMVIGEAPGADEDAQGAGDVGHAHPGVHRAEAHAVVRGLEVQHREVGDDAADLVTRAAATTYGAAEVSSSQGNALYA